MTILGNCDLRLLFQSRFANAAALRYRTLLLRGKRSDRALA
jgi:hypothetical protein